MNIIIQEIAHADNNHLIFARELFIDYFMDLYKNSSSQAIGINSSTIDYLNTIFDNTEHAMKNNSLSAAFAYINNTIVGFTTFAPLEDPALILVRTLPVNLAYKEQELMIRAAFIDYVKKTFPDLRNIIIMVRKANTVHIDLCLEGGFQEDDSIFEQSEYIKKTYDSKWYRGYILHKI